MNSLPITTQTAPRYNISIESFHLSGHTSDRIWRPAVLVKSASMEDSFTSSASTSIPIRYCYFCPASQPMIWRGRAFVFVLLQRTVRLYTESPFFYLLLSFSYFSRYRLQHWNAKKKQGFLLIDSNTQIWVEIIIISIIAVILMFTFFFFTCIFLVFIASSMQARKRFYMVSAV